MNRTLNRIFSLIRKTYDVLFVLQPLENAIKEHRFEPTQELITLLESVEEKYEKTGMHAVLWLIKHNELLQGLLYESEFIKTPYILNSFFISFLTFAFDYLELAEYAVSDAMERTDMKAYFFNMPLGSEEKWAYVKDSIDDFIEKYPIELKEGNLHAHYDYGRKAKSSGHIFPPLEHEHDRGFLDRVKRNTW